MKEYNDLISQGVFNVIPQRLVKRRHPDTLSKFLKTISPTNPNYTLKNYKKDSEVIKSQIFDVKDGRYIDELSHPLLRDYNRDKDTFIIIYPYRYYRLLSIEKRVREPIEFEFIPNRFIEL